MGCSIGGFDVVLQRGPDWLFVRLASPAGSLPPQGGELGSSLWALARDHGVRRLVVELDGLASLDERLLDGLAVLGGLVEREQGLVRVCGLSGDNLRRWASCDSVGNVAHFPSRSEAVGAGAWEFARPVRPR